MGFIGDYLRREGVDLLVTREPGGTPLAEEVRRLLLAPREEPVVPLTELLLVFAARCQHLHSVILPALAQGKWVLCDRFTDATYAYQGRGRGMASGQIEQLEQLVQGEVRPDVTFLLDLSVEQGMQRVSARGELDRFESERQSFFEHVRAGYLARASQFSAQYRIIDASGSLPQVQAAIERELDCLIARFDRCG